MPRSCDMCCAPYSGGGSAYTCSEACPRRRGWRRGDVARALAEGRIPAGLHHRSPLLEISRQRLAAEVRVTERRLQERRAMPLRIQNEIQQLIERQAAQEELVAWLANLIVQRLHLRAGRWYRAALWHASLHRS